MKKILASLIAIYLILPSTFAQDDEIRPMGLGISFFLNDFATANRIRTTSLNSVLRDKKWAKLREMSPGIGISYFKGLTKHVDFAGTIGGSFVTYTFNNGNTPSTTDNFLLEGTAAVNIKLTTEKYWVQPYAILGVGAHKYLKYYGAYLPLGIGFKINFFDEVHLFVNSQYRVPVTLSTANYHFNHSIGVASPLTKKKPKVIPPPPPPPPPPPADTDGDGIPDDKDKCPTVPGLAKYDGCPIPDTDGDGINDEEDQCPTVKGLARYHGCPIPDTDHDGINDEEDKCPTVPGLARYQGCPIPDRDHDGINDEEDKCPDLFGVKENQGCPLVTEEIKKTVGFAAKNILFVTGSYKLVSSSYKGLNDVIKIMQANPNIKLFIDGHTDNVGKEDYNQTLSENRANAVKQYFISKGIAESRITSAGHGMSMPIADNKTAAGRQKNRRVELKLNYY
jgi:outer membrane protein OmpA-like peptidoglycan-associated protein